MSIPVVIILLVALAVSIFVNRELRIVRKVQRDALPTNHPNYRPMTERERRRARA